METFQFRCFIFNFLLKVIRLLGSNRIHLTGLNSQDTKWKVNCNLVKLFHQCHTHTHTHTHTHRHTHTHTDTQLERVRVTSQSENISWSLCVDSRLPRRPLTSFEYECVCVCVCVAAHIQLFHKQKSLFLCHQWAECIILLTINNVWTEIHQRHLHIWYKCWKCKPSTYNHNCMTVTLYQ